MGREVAIRKIMNLGYNRKEAINILDGKNSDGGELITLPF